MTARTKRQHPIHDKEQPVEMHELKDTRWGLDQQGTAIVNAVNQ
jgi:hypothetical protein